MNNDLISREALKKAITEATYNFEQIPIRVDKVQEIIDNAPTVEYPVYQEAYQTGYEEGKNARPQGEWITRHKENIFGQDVVCFECNKCGEYKLPIIHTMIIEPLRVCPNCGADMRGEKND